MRPAVHLAVLALLLPACLPQVGPRVEPPIDAGEDAGQTASCGDHQLSAGETDVDCGGTCSPCALGLACLGPLDCITGVCQSSRCVVPASSCGAFAGCTTFTDATAPGDPRIIAFGQGANAYEPRCLRVRFGQSVTFVGGNFGTHPLRQSCGPVGGVLGQSSGSSATFTLGQALGVFGFYCQEHGSPSGSGMAGALEVVR